MRVKAFYMLIALACIMTVGGVQTSMGAQLDTIIDSDKDESDFKIKYQRALSISYPDGGKLASELRGVSLTEKFVSSGGSETAAIAKQMNVNILGDGSSARISDLSVEYTVTVTGRADYTSVDYGITLEGKISNYRIGERNSDGIQIVGLGWRGLSIQEPVYIDGIEINMPISALEYNLPNVYETVRGTEAEVLLSEPIMDGRLILELPLSKWHYLFDPTGINVDANQYGLNKSIAGIVVSSFTMGESNIEVGRTESIEKYAFVSLDREYTFKTTQASDSATLRIIGYAEERYLDDLEIVWVTPDKEGIEPNTGKFPASVVYGMAGMAAVGGVVFFVFSSRQLKKEKDQGQTGIDPSRLTGYQTSASAGGYQTNRGEAQLTEGGEYDRHKSVYKETGSAPPAAVQSDATCGCAASADIGSECDCIMQGSCLCDATCDCTSSLCKENADSMR